MNTAQLKEQTKKMPSRPGIYLFKNSKRKPLYIGKALNLKNRLKSYLKTNNPRLEKMIMESVKIEVTETENEIEALILESQYIKRYKPDFNIMLRDDKQYGFVGFTGEEYSKIFITHQPGSRNSSGLRLGNLSLDKLHLEFSLPGKPTYIGPFTDIGALKTTLRLLRRIFPYCTCKQTHHNYCLNYHIGKCLGFCCCPKDSPKRPVLSFIEGSRRISVYEKNIKAIKDILSGKKYSLIKKIEKEMKMLSSRHEYEKALELQYKIEKLKKIFANAKINRAGSGVMIYHNSQPGTIELLRKFLNLSSPPRRIEGYDIANIQGKHAVGAMIVFTDGEPNKNEYRKFKIQNRTTSQVGTLGDVGMLREVLARRLKHPEWPMPDLILVDGGKAQFNAIKSIVKNIPIIALTKNEKHAGHKILIEKNKEILLSKLPASLKNLLLQIDSEAHRFAISYYRKLHAQSIK